MRKHRIPAFLILIVGLLGIVLQPSGAATIVGGMISANTTWTAANSPYIAEQSVVVMNGAILTIEPGVTVRFAPDMALSISDGTLVARGTESSNIVFTANASPPDVATNRWGYIGFWDLARDAAFDVEGHYTKGCILEYVVIEYAGGTMIEGAVHSEFSSPLINKCVITRNSLGGIYLTSSPSAVLSGNVVSGNTALLGGGICADASPKIMLSANTVSSNSASSGGAIFVYRSPDAILSGNTVSSNSASASCGGIRVWLSSNVTVSGNAVTDNTAPSSSSSGGSGGVQFESSDAPLVSGNTVSRNVGRVAGIHLFGSHNAIVSGNAITWNSGSSGGGVSLSASPNAILSDNVVSNNSSSLGGGIYMTSSSEVTLLRNTVTCNSATSGGGIYMSGCSKPILSGNTISGNSASASPDGGGVYIGGATGVVLGAASESPTRIFGNNNYGVFNASVYGGSPVPQGVGNVDARNVWWGTTNAAEIQNMIYDFFDDAGKGIVFCEPFFLGWATNDVPISWLRDHGLEASDTNVMADTDHDGSPNWAEFYAGTNPTNEYSVFMMTNIVTGISSNAILKWLSVSNKTYSIECRSSLTTGAWDAVMSGIMGSPPMNTKTVQVDSADAKFYRIKVN